MVLALVMATPLFATLRGKPSFEQMVTTCSSLPPHGGIIIGGVHRCEGPVNDFSSGTTCLYRIHDGESREVAVLGLGDKYVTMDTGMVVAMPGVVAASMAGLSFEVHHRDWLAEDD